MQTMIALYACAVFAHVAPLAVLPLNPRDVIASSATDVFRLLRVSRFKAIAENSIRCTANDETIRSESC